MRRAALLAGLCLAACTDAGLPDPTGGRATGQADRFSAIAAPDAVALLPSGVPASALRHGNDGCYYYETAAGMRPVRYDNDPEHYYCIG
ncbi:hypothetical protein [Pseudogemmobacter humi]|uniref:Uncharacterized protein n=1 Tax=Pseudogemmobacter humi TaxID=2483812 RepID=A0A3P5XMJ3_9RHOB|nr:hypothetical protein [Pseudogemmobacter humi]VDC32011.1 hypothetical protein XINFAN_03271 [Pseudogemmobacter humi]